MAELIEPLSQVVFVEDYFQLVFQDQRLSVFGQALLSTGGVDVGLGEPGFYDALVQLIGQQADVISASSPVVLALAFQGGTRLQVIDNGASPEAFALHDENGRIIVGRSA